MTTTMILWLLLKSLRIAKNIVNMANAKEITFPQIYNDTTQSPT